MLLWRWFLILFCFRTFPSLAHEASGNNNMMGSTDAWKISVHRGFSSVKPDRRGSMYPLQSGAATCSASANYACGYGSLIDCAASCPYPNCQFTDYPNMCYQNYSLVAIPRLCKDPNCMAVLTSCIGFSNTSSLSYAGKILCLTDSSGNYCARQLETAYRAVEAISSSTVPTASRLQAFCTPCVRRLLNTLNVGAQIMAFYAIMCSVSDILGQWCLTTNPSLWNWLASYRQLGATFSSASVLNNAGSLCGDRCYLKLLGYASSVTPLTGLTSALKSALVTNLCARSGSGSTSNLCVASYYNTLASSVSSLSCSALSSTTFSQMGCCLASDWQIYSSLNSVLASTLSSCSSYPASCGTGSSSASTKYALNIQLSWSRLMSMDVSAVMSALQQDIAMNLGIPASYITKVSIDLQGTLTRRKFEVAQYGDPGTTVTLQIQGASSSDTSAIVADLAREVAMEILQFPVTSQLYGATVAVGNGTSNIMTYSFNLSSGIRRVERFAGVLSLCLIFLAAIMATVL